MARRTTRHRFSTLSEALDFGVDFWDVADVYGNGRCESLIGQYFRDLPAPGITSCWRPSSPFAARPRERACKTTALDYMAECLEASLKRLAVERIDLYYVHRIDARIPIEETVGALAKHVASGKIGAIGLSEMAPDTLRRAASVHPIAAMQSEYSLWTRNAEIGLLQACEEVQATFVAFSPLGRAVFTGGLQDDETFPPEISAPTIRVSSASIGGAIATRSSAFSTMREPAASRPPRWRSPGRSPRRRTSCRFPGPARPST